uniref:HrpA n=1 Tax=Pseudomonas syringae pv. helianthi TaxID=251654 RepID=A0A0E4FGZ5_9PSED|nr:HrpA [Pseudomonas syringae pv. helianthi]
MVAFSSLTSKLTNLGNGAVNGVGGAFARRQHCCGQRQPAEQYSFRARATACRLPHRPMPVKRPTPMARNLPCECRVACSRPPGGRGNSIQAEEAQRKQTMDVLNAIEAGKEDSTNKKISATAQNAKGIGY